ncbi:LytTR family DNA-binding domain-containing protein [uncultured Polaribacter sp.]|uniref:LytR/AlgR family response regulator transcription factor n=1 Tax=uncultured Polaribacter sp. TaxID=174711 RepID=UPI002633983B|nr:response regulator transcription factor [uncultured Polaribacter sp.]
MIKYIIVDDEPIAHDIVKKYCDLLNNFQLMRNCYDAIEALEYLNSNAVDVIFLDINMPKLKGFDFLKSLQNPPKVIVTTAYKEHAIEGFELNVVDYLLKPFSFERFLKAINKIQTKTTTNTLLNSVKENKKTTIFLKSAKKHFQVKLSDILFIEAYGNYCKVVTEYETITVREKISEFSLKLSENDFLQVHKSFIVAKKQMNTIEGNQIKITSYSIPIGKTFKSNLDFLLK